MTVRSIPGPAADPGNGALLVDPLTNTFRTVHPSLDDRQTLAGGIASASPFGATMEASQAEKNFYGADVKLHPVTRRPLEQGVGALPVDEQVQIHLHTIEHEEGKDVADAMRRKMSAQVEMQTANAELNEVEEHHHHGRDDL